MACARGSRRQGGASGACGETSGRRRVGAARTARRGGAVELETKRTRKDERASRARCRRAEGPCATPNPTVARRDGSTRGRSSAEPTCSARPTAVGRPAARRSRSAPARERTTRDLRHRPRRLARRSTGRPETLHPARTATPTRAIPATGSATRRRSTGPPRAGSALSSPRGFGATSSTPQSEPRARRRRRRGRTGRRVAATRGRARRERSRKP